MAFIDDLLESGGNFILERSEGIASLRPASDRDPDLESFQAVVDRVRAHEGDGFSVLEDHVSSDRPGDLVDLLSLTIED
ncbi:hypothetical protein [Sphingomonas phyllosphaerae]|uniref:hypothetical protein n=1 Tax=Sphingomonas phyllosphaerae TaxID=257003 RepID=UPI0003B75871|nr:hypothetical protein [Sphingomonas phyllosphaerae]